ncbi:hypothetical protein [Nitrososphaeria virus YSH_1032793]|uniref:Uncharacterized protein n=1 Tax=Nitrososphaeria virus YSH_1032793 TaxID=3071320 RepID=A0A976YEZ6_9CAUD|nr:hypothetical protein QKV91_gp57 [Yangshan Harbor Nitrososphaeria virus]UVF62261.1 hypothetical protein [Nitrososphaeria virus YSH_1032793]
MDSKGKSLTETGVNTGVGFWINFGMNLSILPIFAIPMAEAVHNGDTGKLVELNIYIGIIYTFISIGRQYGFRRLFERFGENENFYTLLKRLLKVKRRHEFSNPNSQY